MSNVMRETTREAHEVKVVSAKLIDALSCHGCGLCVYRCPTGNIRLRDDAPVFGSECLACGICVDVCVCGALHLAVVD